MLKDAKPEAPSKYEEEKEKIDIQYSEGSDEEIDEVASSVAFTKDFQKHKENFSDSIQGMNNDRAFAVIGDKIIVYRITNDNNFVPLTTLPAVSVYKKEKIEPQKLILNSSENSLLFLDKNCDSIFRMDLEKGKVVEEYKQEKS